MSVVVSETDSDCVLASTLPNCEVCYDSGYSKAQFKLNLFWFFSASDQRLGIDAYNHLGKRNSAKRKFDVSPMTHRQQVVGRCFQVWKFERTSGRTPNRESEIEMLHTVTRHSLCVLQFGGQALTISPKLTKALSMIWRSEKRFPERRLDAEKLDETLFEESGSLRESAKTERKISLKT